MEFIQDRGAFNNYLYQHCHCVNAGQSKEERRMKYKLARALGCSRLQAKRYCDWRYNNFAKRFGYTSWVSMIESLEGGDNISNKIVSSK